MSRTEITALRQAAAAMTRDGQVLTADQLKQEADVAEAFDGQGFHLGAPDPLTVEIAHAYLGEGAADGVL